jgi:hypothetical protein
MKAKFTIKDFILVGTAVLSLMLNCFLIYWQNFHSYSDAKASILMPPMGKQSNNDISIDIVFSNSGNQYIVIERAMIMAGGITKKDNSMKKIYSL